jgi:hypothetical protein
MMLQKTEKDIRFDSDNSGQRSGIERRMFCYTLHIPERRSGIERRSGADRRKAPRPEIGSAEGR